MNSFKTTIDICNENLKKWSSNYRIWVLFILITIFIFDYTNEIMKFAYSVEYKVSPWMFPFLFTQKYMIRIIFMGVILLFCDAPFIDETQPYIIIRSGRKLWNMGQICYIFFSSLIYFLFLILISIILNLRYMELTSEWGKILGTLGSGNLLDGISYKVSISGKIVTFFNPITAMILTFVLAILVSVFIGLLIYLVNSFSNTQFLGTLIGIFIVLLDTLAKYNINLLWVSPVSWVNLSNIDIDRTSKLPTLPYIFSILTVLISMIIILIVCCNKKKSIEVRPSI